MRYFPPLCVSLTEKFANKSESEMKKVEQRDTGKQGDTKHR